MSTARALAPLGIYVHWPYCSRLCPYCDFNIVRHRGGLHDDLLAAIVADISGHGARISAPGPLVSLSFGGGTPSLMTPQQVGAAIAAADSCFGLEDDAEISLEANPGSLDAQTCKDFVAAGINRFSIGVQSFDDAELRFLGRDHDGISARRAVAAARASEARVSADFIYDLPGQTPARWRRALDAALTLGLEHYSFYTLTIEPGTAFGRQAAKGRLIPSPSDHTVQLFEITRERSEAAGCPAYEVSNHAISTAAQARHNLLYWRNQDWVGVGPGAHGRVPMGGQRHALTTAHQPQAYMQKVNETGWGVVQDEILSKPDIAMEGLAMGLRLREGVDMRALEQRTGFAPDPQTLHSLVDDGWLALTGNRLHIRRKGLALVDRLVLELLT